MAEKIVKNSEITKDMLIGEIIKKYPKSINILLEQGLECVGCHVASWETLEQGASSHRIDVDKLVEELNKKLMVK